MKTGCRGTFVISWAQSVLDGVAAAPVDDLRPGATWSWTGEALRLDGPAGVLPLGAAIGQGDLRQRVAAAVRRRWGGLGSFPAMDAAVPHNGDDTGDFALTDGHDRWAVGLLDTGADSPPLALFTDDLPPRQTDLWVTAAAARRWPRRPAPSGGVICFTPGTRIRTASGPRPVETLQAGDRVQTRDDGCQPILWIGHRWLTGARLHAMPHLRPIRVQAGALDRGSPDATLLVSPDHRLLLRGPRAQSLFNCAEVLVAARDLLDDRTVVTAHGLREVIYYHLLLPSHQIVWANGVETESFHPASAALSAMDPGQQQALEALLPGLLRDPATYGDHARRVLSQGEAAILRHGIG